jgi:hypothetical protein
MASAVKSSSTEVCPSCGDFVDRLLDDTGFCAECSRPFRKGGVICERCEKRNIDDESHHICRVCRHEEWLGKHADALDRHLAGNGLRIGKAIRSVKMDNRISCLRCGRPMRQATRGQAYFCSKPECRTAQNKLRKLIYVKHIPRRQALSIVLEELKPHDRDSANA